MTTTARIAVLGHGGVGSRIAGGLAAAGANVIGFDVRPPALPTTPMAASIAVAVADADLVLSVNSANVAFRVAEQAAGHLGPTALFADLNPGTPALKTRLAELFSPESFLDVAISADSSSESVPPMAVAGPSADRFVAVLKPLGVQLEIVSDAVGAAAARELTRSILSKGIAGVIVDYMWAAEAMGIAEWAYEELLRGFDAHSAETAKRYLSETVANPKRREIEMLDIVEMLEQAGYHSLFVPPTQLTYNKVYHSIRVPYGTVAEQEKHARRGEAPAADW